MIIIWDQHRGGPDYQAQQNGELNFGLKEMG